MSRVAQVLKSKVSTIVAVIFILGASLGLGLYVHNIENGHVKTVTNDQHQTTEISYNGQKGIDAYTLLKKHATIQSKHYSFGDLVTSINGSVGNGPKYWTFYVNGKEATVGASDYKTKNSDTISWKLQ